MTEQNSDAVSGMTEKDLYDALVPLFNEIVELNLQVKEKVEEAKEKGLEDASLVKTIAKAKAENKVGSLEEKAESVLKKIEELTS